MKYLIFIITLTACSVVCKGQAAKAVDQENGYKEFKLGDLKSKWEKVITPTRTKDYANYYQYTGNCCDTFFGATVKYIYLMFDHTNKLEKINVILQSISGIDNLNAMKQRVLTAYGKDDASIAQDSMGGFEIIWKGKVIRLAVHAFGVKNDKYGVIASYGPVNL